MRVLMTLILLGSLLCATTLGADETKTAAKTAPTAKTEETPKAPARAKAEKKPWYAMLKVKGDFRYRYEFIDEKGRDARHRHRVRGRLAVEASPEAWVRLALGLATGSDDPVSTNQTLTNAFSTKSIGLDLAYGELRPDLGEDDELALLGGKMRNPFVCVQKSSLLWDGDLRFEGGALKGKTRQGPLSLFATAGAFWLLENKADADPALWAAQGGATFAMAKDAKLLLGVSIFHYTHLRHKPVLVEDDDAFGNDATDDGSGVLLYDNRFRLVEVFGELTVKVEGLKLAVYGDVVFNTGCADDRLGFLVGAVVKGWGFTVGYDYRELAKNAVVGAFADSDFAGGGTDGRGHRFKAKYSFSKTFSLGVTYLLDEKGLEDGKAYHRVQADVAIKF